MDEVAVEGKGYDDTWAALLLAGMMARRIVVAGTVEGGGAERAVAEFTRTRGCLAVRSPRGHTLVEVRP